MSIASELTALKANLATIKTQIETALHAKGGPSSVDDLAAVAVEIQSLPSGSSPSGEIEINENGTYDVTDYASAVVNVSSDLPTVISRGSQPSTVTLDSATKISFSGLTIPEGKALIGFQLFRDVLTSISSNTIKWAEILINGSDSVQVSSPSTIMVNNTMISITMNGNGTSGYLDLIDDQLTFGTGSDVYGLIPLFISQI